MTVDRLVASGPHDTFGWLRRPQADGAHGYCYELPSGRLVYTKDRGHCKSMEVALWETETGARYFVLHRVATTGPEMRVAAGG